MIHIFERGIPFHLIVLKGFPLIVAFVVEVINNYLKTLGKEARMAFIGRYYYFTSINKLSKHLGISESKTKTMLYRVRIGLKDYLEKEGIYL